MTTTGVSTRALYAANRLAVSKLTAQFMKANTESTTFRLADAGLTLGARSRESFSFRQDIARLTVIQEANSVATTRLEASQDVLSGIAETAQAFVNAITAASESPGNEILLPDQARANLVALTGAMNSSTGGAYIFGGINSEEQPLAGYYADGSASRAAVASAFQAEFGTDQSDTSIQSITPEQMQAFLEGAFADLFTEANWRTTWSQADSKDLSSQISPTETIETSTNANEAAIRKLMSAYTMVADLGAANLNSATFGQVIGAARELASEAIQDFTNLRARLGMAEQRIADSNGRMDRQISVMENHVGTLEGVDPYEAQARVTELTTQLNTAYALTARLENLSLLNHL